MVHFALIAASAGLILLVVSSKPYKPATALQEIDGIIALKKAWSPEFWVRTFKMETFLKQKGSTLAPGDLLVFMKFRIGANVSCNERLKSDSHANA
jgi:hypothetical protein